MIGLDADRLSRFGGWSGSFGARQRSGHLRIAEQISRCNRCQRSRTANVIDDVFNRADVTDPESDSEEIVELDSGSVRRFDSAGEFLEYTNGTIPG